MSEQANQKPAPSGNPLPQVKNVIAIGAGKGGVGKSTISVNVAVALARMGYKVGLMDGDIYGPSMPTMLGLKDFPLEKTEKGLIPPFVHGIHVMTIGVMVPADKPLIWRGPMAHGAFKQLMVDITLWPELDYLIVDLPPGTGDVPLSLCQLLPLKGAVIVATPQQVALDDCIRAVNMFRSLNTPVLGIVENMSYFVQIDGTIADIFGRGGAQKAAQELGIPFLGELPMYPQLRINCDAGNPTKNFTDNKKIKEAIEAIANNLISQVNLQSLQQTQVQLNVE